MAPPSSSAHAHPVLQKCKFCVNGGEKPLSIPATSSPPENQPQEKNTHLPCGSSPPAALPSGDTPAQGQTRTQGISARAGTGRERDRLRPHIGRATPLCQLFIHQEKQKDCSPQGEHPCQPSPERRAHPAARPRGDPGFGTGERKSCSQGSAVRAGAFRSSGEDFFRGEKFSLFSLREPSFCPRAADRLQFKAKHCQNQKAPPDPLSPARPAAGDGALPKPTLWAVIFQLVICGVSVQNQTLLIRVPLSLLTLPRPQTTTLPASREPQPRALGVKSRYLDPEPDKEEER